MKKDKIAITIDKELTPKIEKQARKLRHTKSSFINYVLNLFFEELEEKERTKNIDK